MEIEIFSQSTSFLLHIEKSLKKEPTVQYMEYQTLYKKKYAKRYIELVIELRILCGEFFSKEKQSQRTISGKSRELSTLYFRNGFTWIYI